MTKLSNTRAIVLVPSVRHSRSIQMAVLIIISGILLVLLAGFLLVPVSLYIDTDENRYEVFQRPVFRFFLSTGDNAISPRLQLAGIRIPLQSKEKARKTGGVDKSTRKKPKRKSRFKRSASAWRFLAERAAKSFHVREAVLDVDTDDVVLNAQLVPVFFWASRGPVHLNTNFNGRVYVHIRACTRLARLLWVFIRFLTKK